MIISDIRKGLETQLKVAVDAYNTANDTTLYTVYENVKPELNGKTEWVRATLLPNNTISVGISKDSPDLYRGFFQVDVFTQKEIGSQKALELLTFIANHFKKGLTLIFLSSKIEIEQTSVLPSFEEDNYFRLSMRVAYFSYGF